MTDFFKQRDVMELLKNRRILLLGDSNVRPLYKDLLCALTHKSLIRVDLLRSPNVNSYFGDIAIQQCGKKNSWSFWENRIFEEGNYRVEMFCTGHLLMDVIRTFLRRLLEVPSSIPQIVYVSYGPDHWKYRQHSLFGLLADLKTIIGQTIIIGSGFPTTKDFFGDPIFDDIPYFSLCNVTSDENMDKATAAKISSLGFLQLNSAFYLRKSAFRGVTTQPGWEAVVVRYTTFLLLTCICQDFLVNCPGRVNQDVLARAIASVREDQDDYRQLLLKICANWLDVKSFVPRANGLADPAVENAQEVLHMLWKLYHTNRRMHKSRTQPTAHSEYQRKSSAITNPHLSTTHGASKSDCSSSSVIRPRLPSQSVDNNGSTGRAEHSCATGVSETEVGQVTPPLVVSLPVDNDLCEIQPILNVERDVGECDDDSLEEGEIRDPLPIQAQRLSCQSNNYLTSQQLLSDISSSEGKLISDAELETISDTSDFQSGVESPAMSVQTDQRVVTNEIGNSSVTSSVECIGYPEAVEISDEENDPREGCENVLKTYKPNDGLTINLDTDDSDSEMLLGHSIFRTPQEQQELIAKKSVERTSISTSSKNNSISSDAANADLMLRRMTLAGRLIPWPSPSIYTAGYLWKWWRDFITKDLSLVICHRDMPDINARIPSVSKGVAVPKIIDDIGMFLRALKNIKFVEGPLLSLNSSIQENELTIQEDKSQAEKLFVTYEEEVQSLNVAQKVHFQIPYKKATKLPPNCGQIRVRDLASLRNMVSETLTATTSRFSEDSVEAQSSRFYSYGEQVHLTKPAALKVHWSPFDSWIPACSTKSVCTVSRSGLRTVEVSSRSEHNPSLPDRTSKSASDGNRKRKRSSRGRPAVEMRCLSPLRKRQRSDSSHPRNAQSSSNQNQRGRFAIMKKLEERLPMSISRINHVDIKTADGSHFESRRSLLSQ